MPDLSLVGVVRITRFGGPEVIDVTDLRDPTPGDVEQLDEVSATDIGYADIHDSLSRGARQPVG